MKKIQDFFVLWFMALLLNQIFFFHGCFKPHCLAAALPHTGVIVFLFMWFTRNEKDEKLESESEKETTTKPTSSKDSEDTSFTKMVRGNEIIHFDFKGEDYIKYIGKKLEEKDNLVIYDRFIEWPNEKGIDIISISTSSKTMNIVLCEYWNSYSFDQLKTFYNQLENYNVLEMGKKVQPIQEHLQIHKNEDAIKEVLEAVTKENFDIRKTLYLNTDKAISLPNEKDFNQVKGNIFRYKDMKIVLKKL